MAPRELPERIKDLKRYLRELEPGVAEPHEAPRTPWPARLDELRAALDGLSAAAEELCRAREDAERRCGYYEKLFELSPDGHLITDPAGTIRDANRVTGILLKEKKEALRGKSLDALVAEADRPSYRREMAQLRESPPDDFRVREWQVRMRRGGDHFSAGLTVTVLHDDERRPAGLHWSLRDITDRKEAELSLRHSEARLRAVLDGAFNGMITADEGGVIRSCNGAAERLFGYAAGELTGRDIGALLPAPPGGEGAPERLARLAGAKQATASGEEVQGRRKDGTRLVVDLSVTRVDLEGDHFFSLIVRDVTAARSAEEALRASEARFRSLVEAAECLIVLLRPDLSIVYFGPFTERITGYASPEVLGRDYAALFAPDEESRRQLHTRVEKALAGLPLRAGEGRVRCKDGSVRWVIWNAQAVPSADGGDAVLMVGTDVTELREVRERAAQAVRLAAIGQVITGLAHESRNTFQRSHAALERLSLRLRDRPDLMALIGELQQAVDHLHHLYEEVRTYAAPIRLELRPCDLADVWRSAWDHLSVRREGRDAVLREETDGCEKTWVADCFRLEQVFHNLFENALEACRDPTVITVRCSRARLRGRPAVRIAVCDNGPGFGTVQRGKVFQPFFTTKTRGTGLGLAIARRNVEAHGGEMAVGEDLCPGAEIVVTLPGGGP
jgi:PAS domain S-box-containing protein